MMPFGFGPRSCIGMRLAQMEVETVIAKVENNVRLDFLYLNFLFVGG